MASRSAGNAQGDPLGGWAGGASLDEQIAYHERKASLLSRCAADLGTTEAHEAAADAWYYLAGLCRRRETLEGTEAGQ
jgi:hypothetical protein